MRMRLKTFGILLAVLLITSVATAWAIIYTYNDSNIVPYTINENSATVNQILTVNGTSPASEGDKLLLTNQLSQAISGKTVTFYDNATFIGTAVTDSTGKATLLITPAIGGHNYQAKILS